MFNTIFLYSYNDLASYLISALYLKTGMSYFPTVELSPIISKIEPLNGMINYMFFSLFDPITAANLLGFVYMVLMFTFSYLVFSRLVSNRPLSIFFSLFSTFSVYNVYRIQSFTTDLYQVFLIPLTIYLLYIRRVKPYFLSFLFIFGFGISIYTTYMCVVITLFWYLADICIAKDFKKRLCQALINVILFIFPLLLVGGIIYSSVLIQSLPVFSSRRSDKELISNMKVKYRPIEDFYNLSFRPWYFVIPPQNSLFFSDLSKRIYTRIETTKYYLADDYIEEEAGGSYLGWHFLTGVLLTVFLLVASGRFLSNDSVLLIHKELIVKLGIVSVLILFVSHPPTFTISGITFYTPTFVIYKILPIFRTLVRFGAVLYFFVLTINYLLVASFVPKLGVYKRYASYLLLVVLTFFLMSVRINHLNMLHPPDEIVFLKQYSNTPFKYAVYPKGDYYSIFWILYHKKQLVNPVDFINTETNFESNKFSKLLLEKQVLSEAKKLDVRLLVVYKNTLSDRELKSLNVLKSQGAQVVFETVSVAILEVN